MTKTAQLDVPPAEDTDEGPTPTKRKTVRIKRPGAEESRVAGSVARISEPEETEQEAAKTEDEVRWLFPALSFVAILVVAVLIYIIIATDINSATGLATDTGWIGKVIISR